MSGEVLDRPSGWGAGGGETSHDLFFHRLGFRFALRAGAAGFFVFVLLVLPSLDSLQTALNPVHDTAYGHGIISTASRDTLLDHQKDILTC